MNDVQSCSMWIHSASHDGTEMDYVDFLLLFKDFGYRCFFFFHQLTGQIHCFIRFCLWQDEDVYKLSEAVFHISWAL